MTFEEFTRKYIIKLEHPEDVEIKDQLADPSVKQVVLVDRELNEVIYIKMFVRGDLPTEFDFGYELLVNQLKE